MSIDVFKKSSFALAVCSLTLSFSSAFGQTTQESKQSKESDQKSECGHAYLGIFGGGGAPSKVDVFQRGFSFNVPDATAALRVESVGESGRFGSALGGAHLGYEFSVGKGRVQLRPAVEFEGYYIQAVSGKTTGDIINKNSLVDEHDFIDKLPLRALNFFGDLIFALHFPSVKWLEPYVGGGVGGSLVWIHNAYSKQTTPNEVGINHFNSSPSASTGVFTAQFKGGLRFNITDHWGLFAEYRYLYLGSTTYLFGFTEYKTHAPTTNWVVHLGALKYNLGVAGIRYKF